MNSFSKDDSLSINQRLSFVPFVKIQKSLGLSVLFLSFFCPMSSNGLHRKNVITVFLSSKTISGLFLCVSQLGEDSVASVSAIYELFPKCPFLLLLHTTARCDERSVVLLSFPPFARLQPTTLMIFETSDIFSSTTRF